MRTTRGKAVTAGLAMVGMMALNFALMPQSAWADKEKESSEYDQSKGESGKGEATHGKESYGHGKREYGHSKESYGHGKRSGGYGGGHGMGMGMGGSHASTGHLLRHMLKHEKDIGLKEDQVTKIREMQLNLDRTRIKAEADIMIAERELRALVEDGKSDLSAIEAKLKQSEGMEAALRLEAIKMRREALALLTAEQRDKIKEEHADMKTPHQAPGLPGHGGDQKGQSRDDGMKGHR